MRTAIYGAGSLGTILGAFITRKGGEIDLVNRNVAHVKALRENGARICGTMEFTQKVNAIIPDAMTGRYDIIFLMTKQQQNSEVVAFLKDFLAEDGVIVTLQNGIPELQWDTINRIHPTCCMCVPSFLIKLVDFAEKNGIDHHKSSLRKCICIGEALYKPTGEFTTLGQLINKRWPEVKLHTTYASTEMQASFTDCNQYNGGHIQPELIIVEFLNENNDPVADNEPGEVTITSLGVEGMPLLRFKTGDVCYHYNEPCGCGRNTMRLSSVIGRKGQMIKYKGTTLYPPALFDILDGIHDVRNYVVEVYTNELGTDDIKVRIGSQRTDEAFAKEIKDIFRSKVRVAPSISFESPEYITKLQFPEMSRKPVKFFDLR